MKKTYLKIAMVLLIAFLTLSAFAAHMMHKPGGPGYQAGMILRLKEKLELTDEQVNKLQAIRNETQGQHKANAEAVKAKRDALRKAVESAAPEAQIRAAATDIGKAMGDQAVFAVANKKKVDAVLTDEQEAKLKELKAERAAKKPKPATTMKDRKSTGKAKRLPRGSRDPQGAFKRIDTNGDGSVSLEEFNAHAEKMQERRPRGGRRGEPKPKN